MKARSVQTSSRLSRYLLPENVLPLSLLYSVFGVPVLYALLYGLSFVSQTATKSGAVVPSDIVWIVILSTIVVLHPGLAVSLFISSAFVLSTIGSSSGFAVGDLVLFYVAQFVITLIYYLVLSLIMHRRLPNTEAKSEIIVTGIVVIGGYIFGILISDFSIPILVALVYLVVYAGKKWKARSHSD